MEEAYMDVAANLLHDMRLKIEGAVCVYECDSVPLRRLAIQHDMLIPASAYDTIGSALYDLRDHIRNLQESHMKELMQQTWGKRTQ